MRTQKARQMNQMMDIMAVFLFILVIVIIGYSTAQSLINSEKLDEQIARVAELEEMIERDDILLNLFLEHPWQRELPVHHRWYPISTGTANAFTQFPDPDKTYQLSY
jgi:hypothetical protein